MKKHPHLKDAEKLLTNQFYTHFVNPNICEISYEKSTSPFAFLTVDPSIFNGIGLSIALDCNDTYSIAELTITCMHAAPVALADPFYMSKSGTLHWNDEALAQWQLECDGDILKDLPTVSNAVN